MEKPKGMATLIGSVPHVDAKKIMPLILDAAPNAPIWPQMPKRSWKEGFLPQYSEGIPGLVPHPDDAKVTIDTKADLADQLTAFYEATMQVDKTGDFTPFEISKEAALGMDEAISAYESLEKKPDYVKVQSTGPISFALTVFNEDDLPLFFDDTFADVVLQTMVMKSRWQIRRFKPYATKGVICFLDEPALSSFGSSTYINVSREAVVERLSEATKTLQKEGGIVGVHVCGNTDWTMLMDAKVDIINFDAYGYGDAIAIYADDVKAFLAGEGVIAWGIVPTNADIGETSAEALFEKLKGHVAHLSAQGIDERLIWEQSIVTPSCGMGTLSEAEAELVLKELKGLASLIQKEIFAND